MYNYFHYISFYLTFLLEDRSINLEEVYTLFNISSLYTVKYVPAAIGAHRHRMHDDGCTDAACSYFFPPTQTATETKSAPLARRYNITM